MFRHHHYRLSQSKRMNMKRWLAIIQSVLASFIGVQKEEKRREDFNSNSPWPFIVTGIVMTLLFVLLLVLLVRWLTS